MDSVAPLVFTPPVHRQQLGLAGRAFALALSLAAISVLLTAVVLKPSPDGLGTHRQMGFLALRGALQAPPCEFLTLTGLPCPTCGMTTSFAWFVRGNWLASFYVQPMGFLLALGAGALFWGGLFMALTGAPLHRLAAQTSGVYWTTGLVGFAILAWGWKMFIHLQHVDGWR